MNHPMRGLRCPQRHPLLKRGDRLSVLTRLSAKHHLARPCGHTEKSAQPLCRGATWKAVAGVTEATTTVTSPSENPLAPSVSPQTSHEQFVWAKQWYPVMPIDFLDESRPHSFTLLGHALALWKDGSGTWRAFEDACPHRLAPLSEGRIEKDGSLLCAYHAWRFDGSGRCTNIPQAKDAAALELACRNPRSCAKSYPTTVAQGLLWVWGDAGPAAEQESKSRTPAIIPEVEELPKERVQPLAWFFRDLPYGADYFTENVTDPAHVNVSHHNVAGNRYKEDQYIELEQAGDITPQAGFAYKVKPRSPAGDNIRNTIVSFQPPSLTRIHSEFDDGGGVMLVLYATPTTPGHCRHIGRQVLIKNDKGRLPKGLAFFALPMPVWLNHTLASVFLHQDMAFLHGQQAAAKRMTGPAIEKYFMATPADKMTIAFRTWMERMAGGGIAFAPHVQPIPAMPASKDVIFDTFTTHTAKCSVCSKALANLKTARAVALVAGTAALVWGVLLAGVAAAARAAASAAAAAAQDAVLPAGAAALLSAPPPAGAWVAAALALLAFGAAQLMDRVMGMMHKYDFAHADNH